MIRGNLVGPLVIDETALKDVRDKIAAEKTLTGGRPTYYVTGPQCMGEPELNALKAYVDQNGAPAEVLSESEQTQVTDVRRTRVCWLDYEQHRGVYQLIWTIANTANQLFRYEIFSVPERIQLAVYDAVDEGFFTWHMDTVPSDMTRKLSISIPLNDPNEYQGGALELHQGSTVVEMEQLPGVPIIFPSWLVHRVTPVAAGKRYSLVAWARGPNWR